MTLYIHIFIYTIDSANAQAFCDTYGKYGDWHKYLSENAEGFQDLTLTYLLYGCYQVTEAWDSAAARSAFTEGNPEYQRMCERYRGLWLTERVLEPVELE